MGEHVETATESIGRQLVRTGGEYAISLVCLWAYFALQDPASWLRLELAELGDRARRLRARLEDRVIEWKVERLTGSATYEPTKEKRA